MKTIFFNDVVREVITTPVREIVTELRQPGQWQDTKHLHNENYAHTTTRSGMNLS
jgi:hypothetical protein